MRGQSSRLPHSKVRGFVEVGIAGRFFAERSSTVRAADKNRSSPKPPAVRALWVFEILRPVGEIFQEGEAGLDVLAGDVGEAVCREGLAGEGCDDRAIDDGLAKIVEGEFPFPDGG